MHVAVGSWVIFFILGLGCSSYLRLWWWVIVDHIAAVAAPDNWRLGGCCRVADRASWHRWRPDIIILFGVFLIPVRFSLVHTRALNIPHAFTLLSCVWRVQKYWIAL